MVAVKTRKLARAAEARAQKDGDLSPALRMGFARAAKDLLDLPLAVIGIERSAPSPADAAALCADGALCFVLGAPEAPRAAAFLGAGVVAALIRQQTIGQISSGSSQQEPRPLTATDAALCAPFVEAGFHQIRRLAPQEAQRLGLDDALCCTWVRAVHDVRMALSTQDYGRVVLDLDLGGGLVQGQIALLIQQEQATDHAEAKDAPPPRTGPAEVMLDIPTELDAVLCRMSLSLTALGDLSPGDILPLPGATVDRTALVDLDGQDVARVVLGQLNGARAVRIATRDTDIVKVSGQGAAPARFQSADAPALIRPAQGVSSEPDEMLHASETAKDAAGEPLTLNASPATSGETDAVSFSIEDAAAEITSLAGLTEEDLAEINAAATADVTGQPV